MKASTHYVPGRRDDDLTEQGLQLLAPSSGHGAETINVIRDQALDHDCAMKNMDQETVIVTKKTKDHNEVFNYREVQS